MSVYDAYDHGRTKAYRAENKALVEMRVRGLSPGMSVAQLERRFVQVVGSKTFRSRYPDTARRVRFETWSALKATGSPTRVRFPVTGPLLTPMILMHELAHAVVANYEGGYPLLGTEVRPHGWQWTRVYLDLVARFMGREARDILRRQFKVGKVRTRKPVKRQLTEEQRQALRERLQRARAARGSKS